MSLALSSTVRDSPPSDSCALPLPRLSGAGVYLLDLGRAPRATTLLPRLTDAERARAARLAPALAERFAARRWGLRLAAGAEMGLPPEAVPLWWDERGRPRLGSGGWSVSASSAGGIGVAAVATRPVGVDIAAAGLAGVARQATAGLPLGQDAAAGTAETGRAGSRQSLRVWMQLEAVLKAAGLDLATPWAARCVRAERWRPDSACVLRFDPPGPAGRRWRAVDLPMPPGFAAILVTAADIGQ
ncbi:MAG: hypothetical protein WD749_07550 [Phycisphaerales bacterium]